MITDNDLRERLAVAAHEEWSLWTKALFSTFSSLTPEGHVIIDRCHVERLKLTSSEAYQRLEDKEKDEMRVAANRYVSVIEDKWPLEDFVGLLTVLERLRSCGKTFSSERVFHALSAEEPVLVHKEKDGISVEDKIRRTISWLHRRAYLSHLEMDNTGTMWRLIRGYEEKP